MADSWEDIDESQLPAFASPPPRSSSPPPPSPSSSLPFDEFSSLPSSSSLPPYLPGMTQAEEKEGKEEKEEKEEEEYFQLMMLVNYTKLTQGKINDDDPDEDLISELEDEILKNFEVESEKLFSAELAFHTDSEHWKEDLDKIESKFPGDHISFIHYPIAIPGRETEEAFVESLWQMVNEPTPWESVNILKCEYLPIINRGILYKYEMATEIKFLAMEQNGLGKLALAMKKQEEEQGLSPPMNVLDQIIAMIFSRLTIYGSEEEHFKKMAQVHEKVRNAWIKDFGCLPPDLLWKGTRITH